MTLQTDPVDLAQALIACPSVTPATGAVFDVLEAALIPLGFDVHRFTRGEAPDGPVENLVALRGSGAPHFGFAGHLDVVPAGEGWASDPFVPEITEGILAAVRAHLAGLEAGDDMTVMVLRVTEPTPA